MNEAGARDGVRVARRPNRLRRADEVRRRSRGGGREVGDVAMRDLRSWARRMNWERRAYGR